MQVKPEKLKAIFTNPDGVLEPLPPSSYIPRSHEMEVYYSFDMDQQIEQKDRIDKCIFMHSIGSLPK